MSAKLPQLRLRPAGAGDPTAPATAAWLRFPAVPLPAFPAALFRFPVPVGTPRAERPVAA